MDDTELKSVLGMRIPVLVVVTSIALGGIALLLSYLTGRFSGQHKNSGTNKNVARKQKQNDEKTMDEASNSVTETGKNSASTIGTNNGNTTSGKRAKNKKRREAQQEFANTWMIGALKGHTGPVLDMNFSSNGKFLASCAEDCDLAPEAEPKLGDDVNVEGEMSSKNQSTSTGSRRSRSTTGPNGSSINNSSSPNSVQSSEVQVESTSSSSSSKDRSEKSSLSRRQRKNRTRGPREQQRRDREDDNDNDNDNDNENDDDNSDIVNNDRPQSTSGRSPSSQRRHHRQSKSRESTKSSSVSPKKGGKASSRSTSRKSSPKKASSNSKITGNDAKGATNDSKTENSEKIVNNSSGSGCNRMDTSKLAVSPKNSWTKNYRISQLRHSLFHLSDEQMVPYLLRYLLTEVQLLNCGYPVKCYFNGKDEVLFLNRGHPSSYHRTRKNYPRLDVNAREFVPHSHKCSKPRNAIEYEIAGVNGIGRSVEHSYLEREFSSDSGNGSGSSVENSDVEPEFASDSGHGSANHSENSDQEAEKSAKSEIVERVCARCSNHFRVNRHTGDYINHDVCVYHWGKLKWINNEPHHKRWDCCQGLGLSQGCTIAKAHVWSGVTLGSNGPLTGYVATPNPERNDRRYHGVYALDCEMCYTKHGLVVARVTIVGLNGLVVYDSLVKPDDDILDYNTRFSGLTEEIMATATRNLREVQKRILEIINSKTIVIGHGLENDFRALKILHKTVIDTSITYPHDFGYPYRSGLKALAEKELNKVIQIGEHDSAEDARIAADLILKKIKSDIYGPMMPSHS